MLRFAAEVGMKTARDCVEKFWLLHFENYKKETQSIRDYCGDHGLKPSGFCDWRKKLKEKYPEKFKNFEKKEIVVLDQEKLVLKNDAPMTSAFFELKADATSSVPVQSETSKEAKLKFTLKHKNYEFQFSTYPKAEWMQNFMRGLD